jgi:hypothetical protein
MEENAMKKRLFPPEGARINLGLCVVLALFLLSAVALLPRMGAERASRNAGIILDFRDVASLGSSTGRTPEAAWGDMARKGATGLMVSELTGTQLSLGVLPLYYGTASGLPDGARKALAAPLSSTALFFPKTFPAGRKALPYLAARFPGMRTAEADGGTAVYLPRTLEDLRRTGGLPAMDGLLLSEKLRIPVFYRVAPALPGDTSPSVAALDRLLADFPSIRTLAPAGETALGFPDLKPLAGAVKKADRSVAVVEFSRQLGAPQLNWLAFPALLPLHSVTHEELLSRNISRAALFERLLRAVKERSVRLLVFRPSAMESSADPYGTFLGELGNLAAGLSAHGIAVSWPEPFSPWRTGLAGAAALALAFVYSLLQYLRRFFLFSGADDHGRTGRVSRKGALLLGAVVLVTALAVRFVPPAARIIGALAAVFVVAEASFLALDGWRRPWAGLVGSFLFAVAGGLAIAAFFSEPAYMLRLRAFSGVKATLFLPPLLVLLADLRRREHPESLGDIFRRPPLWGELFLLGILLAGAGLVLFRSDNVQFVPAFEVRMREFLERILVARPRNKEIFLGYPALLLWYYVRKADLWPRYREVLRMATVLGFSSAVNSFCHFHTPLYFILFRQFNGLWTGVLVGMMGIVILRFLILPLWEKYGRMVTE